MDIGDGETDSFWARIHFDNNSNRITTSLEVRKKNNCDQKELEGNIDGGSRISNFIDGMVVC